MAWIGAAIGAVTGIVGLFAQNSANQSAAQNNANQQTAAVQNAINARNWATGYAAPFLVQGQTPFSSASPGAIPGGPSLASVGSSSPAPPSASAAVPPGASAGQRRYPQAVSPQQVLGANLGAPAQLSQGQAPQSPPRLSPQQIAQIRAAVLGGGAGGTLVS